MCFKLSMGLLYHPKRAKRAATDPRIDLQVRAFLAELNKIRSHVEAQRLFWIGGEFLISLVQEIMMPNPQDAGMLQP
jgi:hypothetical protein